MENIELNKSNPSNNEPDFEDETQTKATAKSLSKFLLKKSSSKRSKLSLKSAKSKLSSKSRSVKSSQSKKILLTKSLDTVKTMLASKESSIGNLKVSESLRKISRATSIGTFLRRSKIKGKKSKRRKMRESSLKLDASTVRKIARELIRKKGCSLLNVYPDKMDKRRHRKKKSKDIKYTL